jgi:hypothetical protein
VAVQQNARLLDGWSMSLVAIGVTAMLFAMRL